MKKIASASLSQGFRFPPEIIRHGVWLYFRFSLSFRDIEELRQWCLKFGQTSANELKHRRGKTGDKWHLDEVFLKMNGKTFSLWRAVDQHGNMELTRFWGSCALFVLSNMATQRATSLRSGLEASFLVERPCRKKTFLQRPPVVILSQLFELLSTKSAQEPQNRVNSSKSVAHLKEALQQMGHTIADTALRDVLLSLGYWLRAKKKTIEGRSHEDRDAQFAHIKQACDQFEAGADPIISVDCKKKELIGNVKNNGREGQAKGEASTVNVYDFLSLADGKAVPYGVDDLVHKQGFVNVGIDHDTAEVALESIRRWWQQSGKALYPGKGNLLITADGGGSNGVSNRLWKKKLQELANEEHIALTGAHSPPATSKWKKIEHRLFSFISINWRAKPLTSLEVVLELISHTTTTEGLTVTAVKDSQSYPTGIKVTDEELAHLHLLTDAFHGEWNSTIKPQEERSFYFHMAP